MKTSRSSSSFKASGTLQNSVLYETFRNAGGGSGSRNLQFSTLATGQQDMFKRTLREESDYQVKVREMEERQLSIEEWPTRITVNVAREDFPAISADIDLEFTSSAAQKAWENFLKDICKKLKIEFIHSILERADKSPVYRILRLRHRGEYLVRQRESSAILEVINTGKNPVDVSWAVTSDINHAKRELAFDSKTQPAMDKSVDRLISRSMTREKQIEVSAKIISATTPEEVITAITDLYLEFPDEDIEKKASEIAEINAMLEGYSMKQEVDFGKIERFKTKIDVVSLHRQCMECFSKFVVQGQAEHIARANMKHVIKVIEQLRKEVDVVVLGLKLITDLMKYLTSSREKIFSTILDCIQAYADPAPMHRPRNPERLRPVVPFSESDAVQSMVNKLASTGLQFPITEVHGIGNIEFRRYGDFYGHHPIGHANESNGMSDLVAQKTEENAGIIIQDEDSAKAGRKSMREKRDSQISGSSSSSSSPAKPTVDDRGRPLEIKAIITERSRGSDGRYAKALSAAYSDTAATAANSGESDGVDSEGNSVTAADTGAGLSTIKEGAEEEAQQQQPPQQALQIVNPSSQLMKSPTKFRIKVKEKSEKDLDVKRAWKGTTGVIGRKAKKIEIEVKIGASKNVVDPFADDPMEEQPSQPPPTDTAAVVVANGEETAASAGLASASGEAISANPDPSIPPAFSNNPELLRSQSLDAMDSDTNALVPEAAGVSSSANPTDDAAVVASAASPTPDSPVGRSSLLQSMSEKSFRRKNRKMKFVLKPLPIVPCVVFTGFAGKMKQNLALTQSFTSLFKMITQNYGNREVAFRMGLLEEICDVALVCQGIPRVLEYVIWIVNCMYEEGFGEEEEVDDNVLVNNANDDYSMILSVSVTSGVASGHGMAAVQFLKSSPVGTRLSTDLDGYMVGGQLVPLSNDQRLAFTSGVSAANVQSNHTLLVPNPPPNYTGITLPQSQHQHQVIPATAVAARPTSATSNKEADSESVNSRTNLIIDTISEMSVPTVDEDGEYSEATPEVNRGDPNIDYVEVERKLAEEAAIKAAIAKREKEKQREALANAARGRPLTDEEMRANALKAKEQQDAAAAAAMLVKQESETALMTEGNNAMAALEEKDNTNIAIVGNDFNDKKRKKPSLMKQKPANGQIVKQIGQAEYERRYVERPKDAVIMACALIANHHELNLREKQMATRWLDTWDDCSREYKLLKKKGADLNGI